MNVAVFGDLHGKILLAWLLCRRWQREHGARVSGILCVGDVGVFPSEASMDPATRRFVRKDRSEAGFADLFAVRGDRLVEQALADVPADLLFVRGNHEDFDYIEGCLRSSGDPAPVDAYGRILYIPDGALARLGNGEGALTVTALGGIAPGSRNPRKRHRLAFIQNEGIHRALRTRADVLLTHEACAHPSRRSDLGSRDIEALLELTQPAFHFSGHAHVPLAECLVGRTRTIGLGDLGFAPEGDLWGGSFGMLRWAGNDGDFSFVADPWLATVRERTWMHVLGEV